MIATTIVNCLSNARIKGWKKTYWAFDVHGTILKPTFRKGVASTEFYPYAKEVLQLLSQQPGIVMILHTCSFPEEIADYIEYFESQGIHFDYINENPEIGDGSYGYYDRKFYFNVLFEDKAGFDPLTEWIEVYDTLTHLSSKDRIDNETCGTEHHSKTLSKRREQRGRADGNCSESLTRQSRRHFTSSQGPTCMRELPDTIGNR